VLTAFYLSVVTHTRVDSIVCQTKSNQTNQAKFIPVACKIRIPYQYIRFD